MRAAGRPAQALRVAVAFGIIHNRLRDWDGDGNHPGYTLGCWLREHAGQVWLFTTESDVEWTSNSAERAVKGPKRHQAVSGYWHTQATLGRWCRIRSYLDSAANHGLTALGAISNALAGNPWLPVYAARHPDRAGPEAVPGACRCPATGNAARHPGRSLTIAGLNPREWTRRGLAYRLARYI